MGIAIHKVRNLLVFALLFSSCDVTARSGVNVKSKHFPSIDHPSVPSPLPSPVVSPSPIVSSVPVPSPTVTSTPVSTVDFRNFYGISWRGTAHENLAYARQMKYDYVFYQTGMENDPLSNGLHFYIESPEYWTYTPNIITTNSYSASQIDFFENFCALKNSSTSFPNNIATGWYYGSTNFTPILDLQQQKVIDYEVASITKIIKGIEAANPQFHFGGLAWDVPNMMGDFWSALSGTQVGLSYWTGGDFGAICPGCTHEFATYSDGHAQFYKQLRSTLQQTWPGTRFVMEPYNVYNDWMGQIQTRSDANLLMPDLLSSEGPGTGFVDDTRVFSSGLITKDRMASTTPNISGEAENRTVAAKAAINGATFTWFGRFGGTGDMPNYSSITAVPARLKLIRALTTFENSNKTPLAQRTWDGTTYRSPTAFADPKAIGALQPGMSKFFVVLMAADGQVALPAGRTVKSISKTDGLFIETTDGSADLSIQNGVVKLNGTAGLGNGYIITLN